MIRLAVRVARDQAELVLAELLELAPTGVEEVQLDAHVIEYAVYGAPGELPSLPGLRAAAGGALVELSTSELPDDWSERWKDFHRPVLLAAPTAPAERHRQLPDLRVRPPWEAPLEEAGGNPATGVEEVVIDPGQAFGTGGHPTTRMCLELLLKLAVEQPRIGALLDVGTGSGVIAIAAARAGFAPVLGVDNDPESVAAASRNSAVNNVVLDVRRCDLRSEALPWADDSDRPPGPLVLVANLLRPLLLDLAGAIRDAPAHLIAGGLLSSEVDEVARAFELSHGLRERERRTSSEWAALWLTAPGSDQARSGISVAARTIER